MSSNPGTTYYKNNFSHLFVGKNCIPCLKIPKINAKEAEDGPFLQTIV